MSDGVFSGKGVSPSEYLPTRVADSKQESPSRAERNRSDIYVPRALRLKQTQTHSLRVTHSYELYSLKAIQVESYCPVSLGRRTFSW